jgi:hypothetical protein
MPDHGKRPVPPPVYASTVFLRVHRFVYDILAAYRIPVAYCIFDAKPVPIWADLA